MAYTINLTDGAIFATVADGTINTSSSMVLVGKNYAGYGEFLDENFIHLLENGANNVAPGAPLTGQLWWDKTTNTMKVYTGNTFKTISSATASATAPTNNVVGDLWWDTTNQQLKVYNGSSFTLIGPAFTPGTGQSGAIVATIIDNLGVDHIVIQLFVNNILVGVISKDSTFTPGTGIGGFSTISPGIQLSTVVSSNLFRGTATDAQLLDGLDSTQFLRSDANDTTSGTLGVLNDLGLTFGADQDGRLSVIAANSEVILRNQTNNANLSLRVNTGGVDTTVMFVNGATSQITFPTTTLVDFTGTITVGNLVTVGTVTATGNITGGNLSGTSIVGTLTTAAQTNITSVGTLTSLAVAGNVTGGNLSGTSIVGTLTTAAQTNITSVGTLTALTVTGNVTGGNLITAGLVSLGSITKTGSNGAGNIGSSTNAFDTIFARATSAQYADMAERFHADTVIEPGTVVELGGAAEIMISEQALSDNVFGVISTRAAYLMNSGAGSDDTHPPVAMAGRVPVRVTGSVRKGDRLVSAGQGIARAAATGEATPFNVIGRALEDRLSTDEGMVEAIVTIK